MGKVLKVLAVVVAIAVIVFAPQLIPAILGATLIATAVTAAVVIGASIALSVLLAPRPSTQTPPPSVFRQAISNSFIIYGRRRVGGLLVFFHSKKHTDKKHYRYFVIACAGHRCAGNPTWMLGDEEVTVNGSNMVTSGPYAGAAWLWFQRGLASETANATFVSECGGKWTSAHKGNGIAAIYAKFRMNDDVIEAGMPNITAIIDGRDEIADPRDASTGYTNNAALVFYDWMAMPREEGGFGAYDDEIPDDDWISAQANVCDEVVEGEARYALDGVITTGASPSEVRDILVINCAGSYTFAEGKHLLRVGYWVPPSETLTESQLAGAIQVSPFLPNDIAANEIQGTFYDPANNFLPAPFSTKTTDPAPTDIRQMDLDLAFCTSRYRGERIATIMLRRAQCEKTVVWPMNIEGLKVSALDVVQLDTDRYGLGNYAWVVSNWALSADFNVVLSLREENEDIYGDPTPTVPDSVDTIDVPDAIFTETDVSTLIKTSEIIDADPADGLLQATDTTITVEAHSRRYSDKIVSVDSDTLATVAAEGEWNHVYYDDDARLGGAVVYAATTDAEDASNSPTNPYRHYVGSVRTDASGGTGQSGGGQTPPGWNPDTFYGVDPEVIYDGGTA